MYLRQKQTPSPHLPILEGLQGMCRYKKTPAPLGANPKAPVLVQRNRESVYRALLVFIPC